jgi:DNA modification methylase
MCVTSPPYYGLRDYGKEDDQIGLEESPEEFIDQLVEVFRGVRDCLTDDGTLWVNIGDSYYNYRGGKGQALPKQSVATTNQDLPQGKNPRRGNKLKGYKEKDLIGIPWMLAFALRKDGWYLRQDIIWSKPNPMPESVRDRCTKSHEYIFLLSKSQNYYFDVNSIKVPTVDGNQLKRRKSVWEVKTKPYKGAHFAVYPSELIIPTILAGSEEGDIILDPFMGSGTTAAVAKSLKRDYLGCELHDDYDALIHKRVNEVSETPVVESTLLDLLK